ncbi:MAG TPA: C25 family cysteine peptidase [Planctomycetota bacterium]|jgi:hypothetical protein|nr:C25 family cysteine peptidase [Planctomycetota bacterium]
MSLLASLSLALLPATPDPPGFLVVAPAAWEPVLAPFLDARRRELRVEFAPLEDALEASPGVDPPERLKRRLYGAWKERDVRFVLLVGDADALPVRFMVLDRVTPPAFDYGFYASDLYYADLADETGAFDSWNASAEGFHARYFGEVRGEKNKGGPINADAVSYRPEIALGRWPVSDATTLAAVVAKTLAWKPTGASPRVLLAHADGWVDARARAGAMAEGLSSAGFAVERQFYGEGVPTPASVSRSLLAGVDLALHVGHGDREEWAGCLGPAEREALAAARPAVFFSVGCGTAHFCAEAPYEAYLDEDGRLHRGTNAGEVFRAPPPPPAPLQPGPHNTTGLGERLLRMPSGGAVAYVGCNTGSQPCALTLLEGFTRALAADPATRIGEAWRGAIASYWEAERLASLVPTEDWYPPSVFFQGMKFMLLGDPTLRLREETAPRTDR